MIESDKKRFAILIGLLHETFGKPATRPTIEGYWIALSDMEFSECEKSIYSAMRSSEFLPTPAKIRQVATGGTGEELATVAWIDVVKAMPLGSYKSVSFRDPVINATIRSLGGWPALFDKCSNSEDETFYRHAFIKTYRTLVSRGVDGEAAKPLSGISRITVIRNEVVSMPPIQVGSIRNTNCITHADQFVQSPRLEMSIT